MSTRHQLKLVLMGRGGVGKTSLVNRYVHQRFVQAYMQTLGQDVFSKKLTINDSQVIVQINDIAGQERFESFRPGYLRGSDIGLAVFDLTIPGTIIDLKNNWIPEMSRLIEKPFFLTVVGNKSDLKDQRNVTEAQGKELVTFIKKKFNNINIVEYIETSAKENANVDVAFVNLVQKYSDTQFSKNVSKTAKLKS